LRQRKNDAHQQRAASARSGVFRRAGLSEFTAQANDYFQLDVAYGEDGALLNAAEKYDAAFFEDSALLIVQATETSGSNRLMVHDVAADEGGLVVSVNRIVPEVGTDDIADWFILIEMPMEDLEGVETYDALYVY